MVKSARGIGIEGRKKRKKRLAAEAAAKVGLEAVTSVQPPGKSQSQSKTGIKNGAASVGNDVDKEEEEVGDWLAREASSRQPTGLLDSSLELVLPLIDNELFGERTALQTRRIRI